MTLLVSSPFEVFTGLDGEPLQSGKIFIGKPNLNAETNPINVYWDKDKNSKVAQPIRTINGYPSRSGAPGQLFTASDFSIYVYDSNGVFIFSSNSSIIDETTGPYVVTNYGDGSLTDETFNAALTSLGAVNKYSLLIPRGVYSINSNIAYTDNVEVIYEQGVLLNVATGVTVSHAGSEILPESQVFSLSGTGAVTFDKRGVIDPIVFGADNTGAVDSAPAFQASIDSITSGIVEPTFGTYLIDATVTLGKSNVSLHGNQCQINTNNTSSVTFEILGVAGTDVENVTIKDFKATATTIGSGGQQFIQTSYVDNLTIEHNVIKDYFGAGIKFNDASKNSIARRNIVDNIGVISIYSEGDGPNGEPNYNITMENNIITNFNYGCEAKETYNVIIKNNYIKTGQAASDKYAIVVARNYTLGTEQAPYNIVVEGNIVEDTAANQYGIFISQSGNITCSGNIVRNPGETGITVSGSVFNVSDNVVEAPVLVGISCNYNTDTTTGAGGLDSSIFAVTSCTVSNNIVRSSVVGGNIPIVFTALNSSTINNNIVTDSQYAGYGMKFDNCVSCDVHDNRVQDGSTTYGFRIESNCLSLRWKDNTAEGMSSATESYPSALGNLTVSNDSFLNESEYIHFLETTDATPASIFSETLGTQTSIKINASILVRTNSYRGVYELTGHFYRGAGGATLQGALVTIISEDNGSLAATIGVNGNDVEVQVTGVAATTLNWKAQVKVLRPYV